MKGAGDNSQVKGISLGVESLQLIMGFSHPVAAYVKQYRDSGMHDNRRFWLGLFCFCISKLLQRSHKRITTKR